MIQPEIKVSIIFPSYNGENEILNNLESIRNLTNSNQIELVIVDNNSSDSTTELIKSFKALQSGQEGAVNYAPGFRVHLKILPAY